MKKNAILTVLFSFVPGAGQMYQGYMKRGLSQITAFVLFIIVGATFFEPIAILSAIVYMYSFFDSLNLRDAIRSGVAPADDFQMDLGKIQELGAVAMKKHNIVGWGLLFFGVYGLYKNIIYPWIWGLADIFGYENIVINNIRSMLSQLPTLMVSVIFVVAGIRLIRGAGKNGKGYTEESDEDFTEYKG